MAEVYRPDVLSFRPVLKSELLHSPQVHHGFVPKLSPHSGKNIKKLCSRLDVCLLSPPSFGGVLSPLCYESGKAERGVVEKNNVRHIVFI